MLQLNPDNAIHEIDDDTGEDLGVICNGFEVTKVLSDLNSSDETALIRMYTRSGDKSFSLPMQYFTKKSFSSNMIGKGLEIKDDPDFMAAILEYAMNSKIRAPIEYTYDTLGWKDFQGDRVYLAHKIISANDVIEQSVYKHDSRISPSGSYESWREGIIPFLSRPTVALALIIGASATIMPLLKDIGVFSETPIFALIGRSSSYKTTMMKMMASIYGNPQIGDGVIDSMIDTTNYFFSNLGKKNGFLHCIDDISAAQNHDFTNELYSISMGKGRGRNDSNGTPKNIDTWCTTVVYTGETSILEQTNKNKGLYARVIELNFEWLSVEDDIDGFYNTINNNFGVALDPLVKTILTLSNEEILTLFNSSVALSTKTLKPANSFDERISIHYAILLTTLEICNIAWDLSIETKPLLSLFKETYDDNLPPTDPVEEAKEKLIEQILVHGKMFVKDPDKNTFSQSLWGVYGTHKHLKCLWIIKGKFEEMAKAAKIPSIKALQRQLADAGFLIRDSSNHYAFKRNITSSIKAQCYGIYLNSITPKNKDDIQKKKQDINVPKVTPSKSQSKITNLLSEDESNENCHFTPRAGG